MACFFLKVPYIRAWRSKKVCKILYTSKLYYNSKKGLILADLENKKVLQNIFGQSAGFKPLMYILSFIASTTWLLAVIYDVAKDWDKEWTYIIFSIFSISIIVGLYFYMSRLVKKYSQEDNIDINYIDERPHEVIILFLSFNHSLPTDENLKDKASVNEWLNIDKNPWKMPSVAIQKSHSTLKDIFVLTSKESREQFELFQSVVAKLDERDFNVIEKHIENMDNIEKYKSIFHTIYSECKEKNIDSIAIDITSGSKLYSIAGSYYGLSFDKIVQYVNQNDYSVHQYDNKIVVES